MGCGCKKRTKPWGSKPKEEPKEQPKDSRKALSFDQNVRRGRG